MGNGEWGMGNGEWEAVSIPRLPTPDSPFPTPHSLLSLLPLFICADESLTIQTVIAVNE